MRCFFCLTWRHLRSKNGLLEGRNGWKKSLIFSYLYIYTVDGRNPANQLIGSLSHYL